jgi:hypothetical protein
MFSRWINNFLQAEKFISPARKLFFSSQSNKFFQPEKFLSLRDKFIADYEQFIFSASEYKK